MSQSLDVLTPKRVSSRSRARQLFEPAPLDLSGLTLVVDFATHASAPPSFLDEIVRVALEERNAAKLEVINVDARLAQRLEDSAAKRGVQARIKIDRRG